MTTTSASTSARWNGWSTTRITPVSTFPVPTTTARYQRSIQELIENNEPIDEYLFNDEDDTICG